MLFNSALRTRRAVVFLSVIFMKRIFPLTQLIIRFDCFICEWERRESVNRALWEISLWMRTSVNALDYCAPQYIQRYIGVSAVCAVNFLNYFRKVFLRARVSGCGFFNFFFFLFFFITAPIHAHARFCYRFDGTCKRHYPSRYLSQALLPLVYSRKLFIVGICSNGRPREERQDRKSDGGKGRRIGK